MIRPDRAARAIAAPRRFFAPNTAPAAGGRSDPRSSGSRRPWHRGPDFDPRTHRSGRTRAVHPL
jgi:hypothetical protein